MYLIKSFTYIFSYRTGPKSRCYHILKMVGGILLQTSTTDVSEVLFHNNYTAVDLIERIE